MNGVLVYRGGPSFLDAGLSLNTIQAVLRQVCNRHWVWGGGFLAAAGVLDFAGGLVVHLNAGIAGLVCALVLGRRQGYGHEYLAPHDLVLTLVGTSLLWVGWFGFNAGSALSSGELACYAILN